MAENQPIPVETLHQLLFYDAEAGKLYWKERPRTFFTTDHAHKAWNAKLANKEAFTYKDYNGYYTGRIFRILLRAHRVIWAMVHGAWPEDHLDHIDHDRGNNRIQNLRIASHGENLKNMTLSKANKTGFCGVFLTKETGKWWAYITVGRKRIHLGSYDNMSDAITARQAANLKYSFHKNHGLEKESA